MPRFLPTGFRRSGVLSAMNGINPAFGPNQPPAGLPANFGFNDLAGYEQGQRTNFANQVGSELDQRRAALASSLQSQGEGLFKQANPGILEDLNSRGLMTSPSAVNQAQTDALKQIGLANQGHLNDFDNSATATRLQLQQNALDSGLDLTRGDLDNRLQQNATNQEQGFASDLARQQNRNNLTNSLISGGTSILGASLMHGGALSGIFGGGGATGAAGGAGGVGAAGAGTGAAGTGTAATGGGLAAAAPYAAVAGAGIGSMMLSRAAEKRAGGGLRGTIAGTLASPIGQQLNLAKSAVNKVSHIFCFDGMTPVMMADGTKKPICEMDLDDDTLGGTVESLRVSKTDHGTRYTYEGEIVTGKHAVLEDGKWIRVENSHKAKPLAGGGEVYSLVTSNHRIYVNNVTFADEHETDNYETLSLDDSLAELNRQLELSKVA